MTGMGLLSLAALAAGVLQAALAIRSWARESRDQRRMQGSPWSSAGAGGCLAVVGLVGIVLSWMGFGWGVVLSVLATGMLVAGLLIGVDGAVQWANKDRGEPR